MLNERLGLGMFSVCRFGFIVCKTEGAARRWWRRRRWTLTRRRCILSRWYSSTEAAARKTTRTFGPVWRCAHARLFSVTSTRCVSLVIACKTVTALSRTWQKVDVFCCKPTRENSPPCSPPWVISVPGWRGTSRFRTRDSVWEPGRVVLCWVITVATCRRRRLIRRVSFYRSGLLFGAGRLGRVWDCVHIRVAGDPRRGDTSFEGVRCAV